MGAGVGDGGGLQIGVALGARGRAAVVGIADGSADAVGAAEGLPLGCRLPPSSHRCPQQPEQLRISAASAQQSLGRL